MNTDSIISPPHALIHIMLTMAAADGPVNDSELLRVERLISFLPVFQDEDENTLALVTESFAEFMSADDGLDTLLALVSAALPERLHETAYALAVEIAAADLAVKPEEIRLLDLLRDFLKVDKLAAAAIERGARARFSSLN